MFDRPRLPIALAVLLLLMPQYVYVIGDYLAAGIRFPFFRVQVAFPSVTAHGNTTAGNLTVSTITVMREVQFISMGIVGKATGRTAVATYLWLAGLAILVLAVVLVLSWKVLDNPGHGRFPGPLVVVAGLVFLAWGAVQFGPLYSGPSGYAIPIGIPFVLYIGYLFMKAAKRDGEKAEKPAS